ncbi:LINE-1 retrotransposable element ORF1 protein [Anabarilius grahami]|uniref:LINE-1 retrotransposable element ORF1 protein n=1 Tax=Anabarilius grahami TaxID=495550 RepID=A0A3N0Z8U3_ANAGA|nr:LINE-1 retrotransposable element ORF1 protein [Anabarilius grahami]
MTALNARLDMLDATLVNLLVNQAGIKQKMVETEGALNGTDLRLGEVEKIDRAHRALLPKPSEGQRPRTIIARIHNDRDKDLILRLSWDKFPLEYKGKRIHIFPDYTPEVTARQRAFSSVTKALREAGLK